MSRTKKEDMTSGDNKSTISLPFLTACEQGETGIVSELLAQGINVDVQNEAAVCGLFKAAECGNDDVLKILLEHKANVNKQNGDGGKSALMAASKKGHSKTVKILLEYGADLNMQDNEGWSALLIATYYGNTEIVKCLLEHKVSVNTQAKNGWSALMFAVLNSHSEMAKLLLEHGAHINIQNNIGSTSLMIAAKNGYKEIANLLIEYKADVNIQMKAGWTALMFSGEGGHTEIARLLLENKAKVDMQMKDGLSSLILASQNGHIEMIELLLEYKADINKATTLGLSALMIASQSGNIRTVKLLLERQVNVNAQMKDSGWSALMISSQQGHANITNILLEYGAHVNLLANNGLSALMLGCLHDSKATLTILLEYEADVNTQMNDGLSALMIASQNGNIENARLLLKHGAHVDMIDVDGWSALMYSSQNGFTDIIELLLEDFHANVNKQDNNGWSALMVASQNGHDETVYVLLEYGADESQQTSTKLSALMIASRSGHTENVFLLLDHGANADMCDVEGWSAMMYASQYGYTDIVELLLDFHANVNKQDRNGWSALMVASQFGHDETAYVLLGRGADINLQTVDKLSALMIASQFGNTRSVQLLLKHLANLNLQDKNGSTALIIATQNGHSNIVKLLVKCKIDVNQMDNNGWTALMFASQRGCTESVKALLEAGANVNLRAGNGWTALMIANLNGDKEIAKLLQESKPVDRSQSSTSYGAGGIIHSSEKSLRVTQNTSSGQSKYSPIIGGSNRSTLPYRSTRGLKFTLGISSSGYGSGSGPEELRSTSCELSSGSVISNEGSRRLWSYESLLLWKLASWKCAETAVLIINSEKDHYFTWKEFGLNLQVASKSLPPELLSCTIHITATPAGNYQFPPNSYPVSAVYWLRCIPACKFVKPVILEIQHCGRHENLSKLYFAKASSSLQEDQYYHFHKAEGCSATNHGVFPAKSSYGFIQLQNFSGYGVVQEDSDERNYCASLYYLGQYETQCQIHFTISWNTDAHRTVLNEFYQKKGCASAADQQIEFESDRISLDIPMTGVITQNRGWRIIPLVPPVIMKKEVDSFKVGKRIPACQLQATADMSIILTDLHHVINLNGAKDPFNVFTIYRHNDSYRESNTVHFKWGESVPPHPFSEEVGPKTADSESESSIATGPKLRGKVRRYSAGLLRKLKRRKMKQIRKGTRSQFLSSVATASLIEPSLDTQMEIGLPLSLDTITMQESEPIACFDRLRQGNCPSTQEVTVTESIPTLSKPPEFVVLLKELSDEVSPKWEDIGLNLQLRPGLLEIIKADNPGDCRSCFKEMLKEWMKQVEPPPSWPAIITAIKICGYRSLARKLKVVYLPPTTVEMLV